jgi:outer membrane lipoprotein SlyB
MNRPTLLLTALFTSAALLSGCASNLSGSSYSRADARAVQNVRMGTIESLRPVQIEGTKTPIGTLAGAAVGGIAGNSIGGGRGKAITTILGGVAGGAAGSAVEEGITRTQGVEIVRTPHAPPVDCRAGPARLWHRHGRRRGLLVPPDQRLHHPLEP